jgi:hypothetical protein
MTRRFFTLLPMIALSTVATVHAAVHGNDGCVPTDIESLNNFALAYNAYAEQIRQGVIDTKLWKRAARMWNRLVCE